MFEFDYDAVFFGGQASQPRATVDVVRPRTLTKTTQMMTSTDQRETGQVAINIKTQTTEKNAKEREGLLLQQKREADGHLVSMLKAEEEKIENADRERESKEKENGEQKDEQKDTTQSAKKKPKGTRLVCVFFVFCLLLMPL